jgi:hypothetical protein
LESKTKTYNTDIHVDVYSTRINICANIQNVNSLIVSLAYIGPGFDVGSSLAKQRHDLGLTISSGCNQRGKPSLLETIEGHAALSD